MERYLMIETKLGMEITEIEPSDIPVIESVVNEMKSMPTPKVKLNREDEYTEYGHINGFEFFVQFIPDEGIQSIQSIKITQTTKTLV